MINASSLRESDEKFHFSNMLIMTSLNKLVIGRDGKRVSSLRGTKQSRNQRRTWIASQARNDGKRVPSLRGTKQSRNQRHTWIASQARNDGKYVFYHVISTFIPSGEFSNFNRQVFDISSHEFSAAVNCSPAAFLTVTSLGF